MEVVTIGVVCGCWSVVSIGVVVVVVAAPPSSVGVKEVMGAVRSLGQSCTLRASSHCNEATVMASTYR